MSTERPTCRVCACAKVCVYFKNENDSNLTETCPLSYWEKYFVPKQEWISVDERLPDGGGTYLTVDDEGYMIVATWHEFYGWLLPVCRANPITHWMPIPEPPTMKGGAE